MTTAYHRIRYSAAAVPAAKPIAANASEPNRLTDPCPAVLDLRGKWPLAAKPRDAAASTSAMNPAVAMIGSIEPMNYPRLRLTDGKP